jgi:hypothetical protein
MDFTSRVPDPDHDSESVQTFLSTTEGAFQTHPLFANATDEELESAGEVSFLNLFMFSSSIVHHFVFKTVAECWLQICKFLYIASLGYCFGMLSGAHT